MSWAIGRPHAGPRITKVCAKCGHKVRRGKFSSAWDTRCPKCLHHIVRPVEPKTRKPAHPRDTEEF